jgi:hypothetical protein
MAQSFPSVCCQQQLTHRYKKADAAIQNLIDQLAA